MGEGHKRSAVRIRRPIEVVYQANCPPIAARIEDVSETGAFIETSHPLSVGTEIEFVFSLPGAPERTIEGRGKVVWADPVVGVGIEFVDLSPLQQSRIKFYVASEFFGEGGES